MSNQLQNSIQKNHAQSAIRDQALYEVQSCIGCNECLIACPIEEKALINISTLNTAVLSEQLSDHEGALTSFLEACTQCQRCVPVCPVDISRANMVLYNQQKLERQGRDRALPITWIDTNGEEVQTLSGWTVDEVALVLKEWQVTPNAHDYTLRSLTWSASILILDEGEQLFNAGDYHELLYIVLNGRLATSDAAHDLLYHEEGDLLGLAATLTDEAEHHGVYAHERTEVLRVHKTIIHRLSLDDAGFKRDLDHAYQHHHIHRLFTSTSPFATLSEEEQQRLLDRAELMELSEGETLLTPNQKFEGLYLVKAGFLQLRHEARALDYYGPGDTLGTHSVLRLPIYPHAVLRATTRCVLLFIHRKQLRQVLTKHSQIINRLEQEYNEYLLELDQEIYDVTQPKRSTTNFALNLTNIGERGLLGAERLLVIDQNLCTDCNACVDACQSRHGAPRLKRTGLQLDHLLFPSACRHCEDPKCLMCTVRGITRESSGEIRIDPDGPCVGCGACATRCPYDNIQMVPRRQLGKSVSRGSLWRRVLSRFLPSLTPAGETQLWTSPSRSDYLKPSTRVLPSVHEPRPALETGMHMVATKCDLCVDHKDQACVSACPVGAAFRVSGQELYEAQVTHPKVSNILPKSS